MSNFYHTNTPIEFSESFFKPIHNEPITAKALIPLMQEDSFSDIVWIYIAYNIKRQNMLWAKVATEILSALDPSLTNYNDRIESRVRITFGELENLKLAKLRLGEDLLDAGIPLSMELQEILFAELCELACQATEMFERSIVAGKAGHSIDLGKELPWLKMLDMVLTHILLSMSFTANMEITPSSNVNAAYEPEHLAGLDSNQIWEQFHKTRGDQFRNLLLEHYRHLVKYAAERVHSKLPDKVELDDLISAGTFGLMDAIEEYDPVRGVKFETYCLPRIKGSILDELRNMEWVPRLVRTRAHQLARSTQSLEASLGRKPTIKETAEKLNMNMEEFNRLRQDANAVKIVSLNTQYGEGDDEKDIREIDLVKDQKSDTPSVEIKKQGLNNLFTKGLTRTEEMIVVLYYYEEMTMKEIGTTLDLSESCVSRMHSSIVQRLKAQLNTLEKKFITE